MRIDPMRVSQAAPAQRVGGGRDAVPRRTQTPLTQTSDLLTMSASVAVSQTRETMVNQLRDAYRSGALQPDPARIADRLMQWGFDFGREASL